MREKQLARCMHLFFIMRRCVLFLFLFVSLLPNIAHPDVRIFEHNDNTSVRVSGYAVLPDPVATFSYQPKIHERLLLIPADGRISSLFGMRDDPVRGGIRFHAGLDFANMRSSAVVAATGGRVGFAGWAAGCGLAVTIDHGGGLATRYCHLHRLAVGQGDEVAAGDLLGTMGASGRTSGTHLHFEVREGGGVVDPAPRLAF